MTYLLLVMLAALLFVLTGCVSAKKALKKRRNIHKSARRKPKK